MDSSVTGFGLFMGFVFNKIIVNFGQSYPSVKAVDILLSPVHCLLYGIPLGLHQLLSPLPSALMPPSRTPPLCLQEDTLGSTITGHHFHKLQDKFIEDNINQLYTVSASVILYTQSSHSVRAMTHHANGRSTLRVCVVFEVSPAPLALFGCVELN